ncbi:hypothetical protein C1Y63_06715 [Corynebacterium sp. 13CS0277]|uniref:hypothetical protein n=1 Tax=Corynebacterium sp. 13CS0277 TaxID=2071994 RepID=UPI000D033DC5|nr:hypothetical protein [Corynebacterium sp. 13CS0277]PRQ11389.1 hypothetical protein C1Y63_06715 [Corynebacterium sp. 13CS0277]
MSNVIALEKKAALARLQAQVRSAGGDLLRASALPGGLDAPVSAADALCGGGDGSRPGGLTVIAGGDGGAASDPSVGGAGVSAGSNIVRDGGGSRNGDSGLSNTPGGDSVRLPAPPAAEAVLPVAGRLGELLPGGGFPRRAISEVDPCCGIIADLVAGATAAGQFVAIVGWPDLLLAEVADRGDLSRVVVVPDPGADPLHAIGVLAEGVDLVVFHSARDWQISPTRVRPLLARLRGGTAAVLMSGAHAPSPALRLRARTAGVAGLRQGAGRIRGLDVEVQVVTKNRPAVREVLRLGAGTPATAVARTQSREPTGLASVPAPVAATAG